MVTTILKLKGLPASSGIAIGPTWIYRPAKPVIEQRAIRDVDSELERFVAARRETAGQLERLKEKARAEMGEQEAAIFEAHQLILEDPELIKSIETKLREEKINIEAVVQTCFEDYATELAAVDDEYIKARAADLRDVEERLLNNLLGINTPVQKFPDHPVIVIAEDLTPSDTVQFDKSKVLGFATLRGGPTSHTAILATSMGIPAVVSLPGELAALRPSGIAILNGNSGELIPDPDPETIAAMQAEMAQWRGKRETAEERCLEPAITLDGHTVELVANIGNADDAQQALKYGAEGVGLFRTEFLFLDRTDLPGEDEQTRAYREVFDVMQGKPVVVRTLDIGGDKSVPYLGIKHEANPFLGWRAVRMLDERVDVLISQFRALLRAGVNTDLRIMVPMVSRLTEVEQARALLQEATSGLEKEGIPFCRKVQFGVMIEVPSAVLVAEHIAPLIDFFSIGTNDLTQYTMAVDRTNERVAAIASPFHPSVLRLINLTIEAAHTHGKWVGLCGEFAANPLAVPLLLGMDLDEFSMSPVSIPGIKEVIRKLSLAECKDIASHALRLPKTDAVRAYLQSVVNAKTH